MQSVSEGLESLGVAEKEETAMEKREDVKKGDEPVEETERNEETEKDEERKEGDTEEGMEKESHDAEDKADLQTEQGTQEQQEDEEWDIACSDDDIGDPENWTPPPAEIKRLYELLAKGEVLQLNWIPLPRRPPTPQYTPSPERDGANSEEEQEEERRKTPTPTEFDFDDEPALNTPKNTYINRRRMPGSSARSSIRREARLDKVLSDMKRHRKMEEHIMRTGRDLFRSDRSRLGEVGEPLSPNSQKERDKERERDSDPSTIFSPRQRRY